MKNVCLSEVLWRFKLRLNTVRHVTSIGPSITPVSTICDIAHEDAPVSIWPET